MGYLVGSSTTANPTGETELTLETVTIEAAEYRNREGGEITTDEDVADNWTDCGCEVDFRADPGEAWTPWNDEAGYDYASNRYHGEAGQ